MSITKTNSVYNRETLKYDETTSTFAEGATLRVWYDSVRVMSDVWETAQMASYWSESEQKIKTEMWITTATVDATPEVLAKVENYLYQEALARATGTAQIAARRIVKGSTVKVVSGRNAKGTTGRVEVVITRPYGMGYRSALLEKYGIATSDVKVKVVAQNGRVYENYRDMVWVWAKNCEMLDVPAIDQEQVEATAKYNAASEMKQYLTARDKAARKVAA
jgi:hypothetical protein